jgi:methyl-accepting chemotaxis protein
VVASEVKALANQTSAATGQISHQIGAIQEATKKTAQEISSIARSINELTDAAKRNRRGGRGAGHDDRADRQQHAGGG